MGESCAFLQSSGTEADIKEVLDMQVSIGAMVSAVSRRSLGEIPSGPPALCGFNFLRWLRFAGELRFMKTD